MKALSFADTQMVRAYVAHYFAEHPEFVHEMIRATRVIDVNDQSVSLLGRGDKQEMLGTLEPDSDQRDPPDAKPLLPWSPSGHRRRRERRLNRRRFPAA